jgi:hypothetical protein
VGRRGEIVMYCDRDKCHAEQDYDADDLADFRCFDYIVRDDGWKREGILDICPLCAEEDAHAGTAEA